jgi:predicted nucleotidyltransferase
MFGFLELHNHLEALLGCSVDLDTPRSLKRCIRDRVLSEAVEIG